MNKWIGNGNLVRDVETRNTQNGTQVSSFTIACNRSYKKEGQQNVDYIKCIAFGKNAEFISKWFSKGKPIMVEGEIQVRSWKDEGGQNHTATEVIVDRAEFFGGRAESSQNNSYRVNGYKPADRVNDIESEENLPF